MTVTAKLQKANIRTADFYLMDGMLGFHCHDLLTFGSTGASIAASRGRYAWIFSPDHPGGYRAHEPGGGWPFGQHMTIAFSDDPGCPPDTLQIIPTLWYWSTDTLSGTENFIYYHYNCLVYNPDDATYPFYLYCEGLCPPSGSTTRFGAQHECGLLRSADLINWIGYGATHVGAPNGYSSFQVVKRLGVNSWISIGQYNINTIYKYTSTDARVWTVTGSQLTRTLTGSAFAQMGSFLIVNDGGQDYMLFNEDARVGGVGGTGSGQFATLAAIDSNYNVIASPAPQRLTPSHEGFFPGLSFLQSVHGYYEDGILHFWTMRGYFSDTVNPVEGIKENVYDYYTAIVDSSAAATAAPVGVKIECQYGCVVLSWYDALPAKTYRIYRSTDGSTWGTAIASSVSGLQYVDTTGTLTLNTVYYYKVVTMSGGTEQTTKYRVTHTYVSNGRELTNRHCARVFKIGGPTALATINVAWLDTVVTWLHDNCLTDHCLFWVDPSFGHIKDGSNILSKVFCLGSTIWPRGGDYVPCTSNGSPYPTATGTTYNATGMGSIPAWVNGSSSAFGRFGTIDPIRRKLEGTFVSVYKKSGTGTATFLNWQEGAFTFQHSSAGDVNMQFVKFGTGVEYPYTTTVSKTVASHTANHIAIGVHDGLNPLVYVDGVVSGAATGSVISDSYIMDGGRDGTSGQYGVVVGSGSSAIRGYIHTVQAFYSDTATAFPSSGYLFNNNEAAYSSSTLAIFDLALSAHQVGLINTLLTTRLGGASYTLPSYNTPFVKNIKTDYSATGNGSTDDAVSFGNFRTAAIAWQASNTGLVVLQMPAGSYLINTKVVAPSNSIFSGITRFLLLGESRTTTNIGTLGVGTEGFNGGGSLFMPDDIPFSARIQTVAAGSTTATLTVADAAKISLFTAGKLVMVAGIDLQGFGSPPNPHVYEFRRIASIASTTITFTEPLEYGYKSTWPLYNPGSSGHSDQGGPGTVYQLYNDWDCEHEYRNFTQDQAGAGTSIAARFATLRECGSSVTATWFASGNHHFIADNLFQDSNPGIGMEIDKIVTVATVRGGVHRKIHCQSTTPMRLELGGGVRLRQLQGTGKRAYLDGFDISESCSFGPSSYGAAEKVFAAQGAAPTPLDAFAPSESLLVAAGYTMVSGVITGPKTLHPTWAVPGAKCLWGNTHGTIGCFTIIDIAESGPLSSDNIIITTDWSGGFPPGAADVSVRVSGAPQFFMRNVADRNYDTTYSNFGDSRNFSKIYTPNAPIYSNSRRFLIGPAGFNHVVNEHNNIAHQLSFAAYGKLVSIKVVVSTAYTGPTATLKLHLFAYGNIIYQNGDFAPFWDPQIDLRTTGTRIITASGVTSGPFGLDSDLAPPANPLWVAGPLGETATSDVFTHDAGPIVEIATVLDQSPMTMTGSTAPTPFPILLGLRMRIRS